MPIDFKIPVTQKILSTVSEMDRLRGNWTSNPGVSPPRLRELEQAARVQSIAASCRLSGIHVTEADVAGILRGVAGAPADSRAIHGYAAALDHPLATDGQLLSVADLARLNAVVIGDGDGTAPRDGTIAPSPFREQQAHCEAFDADGKAMGRVIPILPPRMIDSTLEDLITWFEFETRSGEAHPVLVIAVFSLGLMAISPFEHGNGRTIRALQGKLLRRAGYEYARYASIERPMEALRVSYYESFDEAQTGIWNGTADFEPWLNYFMELLDRHREGVESKLEVERSDVDLPPLQQQIVEAVREHGTVDAGLLIRATGANRNTLKDNVRRLVQRGILEKSGQRRGTRYRLAAPTPAGEPAGS